MNRYRVLRYYGDSGTWHPAPAQGDPMPKAEAEAWIAAVHDRNYAEYKLQLATEPKRMEFTVAVKVPVVWNGFKGAWEIATDEVETTTGGLFEDAETGAWVPEAPDEFGQPGAWVPNDTEQALLHDGADRYVEARLKGDS